MASPHGGSDPLSFIYGNRLPRYLWTEVGWGEELGKRGITLQEFIRLAGRRRRDFVRWAKREIGWTDYVAQLLKTLLR